MITRSESIDTLFDAFLKLESREECYLFFEDLCTVQEILDMAQRLETAQMLDAGNNYSAICEKIGISTATIGRVSRCLKYGEGGYRLMLDRLSPEKVEKK